MSKFKSNKEKVAEIIKILSENLDVIVQNPYGNYAIQHAIDVLKEKLK